MGNLLRVSVVRAAVAVSMVLAAGPGSAQDQQGRKEFSQYLGANADIYLAGEYYNRISINAAVFTSHPGVGATPVGDWASVTLAHEEPGSSVGLTCYPDGAATGQFDVADEAVSISPDLSTASARWTFTCNDGTTTVGISISWEAGGRYYAAPFHAVSREPFGLIVGRYFFREHTFFSGTVSIAGGAPLPVDLTEQTSYGLFRFEQGYIAGTY
jgi:hypothetical protein